jgi:queuosine precursor transporter
LANLSSAHFGPAASVLNAFLFIGLDLTGRDKLHDAWYGRGLWWKMALLIAAGSVLSYALNQNAGRIAVASFVAFAASALTDTLVYVALGSRSKLVKINGSNILSAAVDSVLFPTLAFGAVMPGIILGQWAAKVGGGFLWALIFRRIERVSGDVR